MRLEKLKNLFCIEVIRRHIAAYSEVNFVATYSRRAVVIFRVRIIVEIVLGLGLGLWV